jgi:hypothetical protein
MRDIPEAEIEELFRLYVLRVDMLPPLVEREAASRKFNGMLEDLRQKYAPESCPDRFRMAAIAKVLKLRKREGGPAFPTMPKK